MITYIPDEIRKLTKKLDDIEWENHRDPRIEGLIREINYLKNKVEQGDLYEPDF